MPHSKRAFTLIELLVVIAIVTMLVAILLPSLSSARNAAKSGVCLSNLKRLGTGMTLYVNANREHFESGIKDLALGEVMFPGVIEKILTNPVDGLDGYQEMMRLLVEEKTALKVYVNVADE